MAIKAVIQPFSAPAIGPRQQLLYPCRYFTYGIEEAVMLRTPDEELFSSTGDSAALIGEDLEAHAQSRRLLAALLGTSLAGNWAAEQLRIQFQEDWTPEHGCRWPFKLGRNEQLVGHCILEAEEILHACVQLRSSSLKVLR